MVKEMIPYTEGKEYGGEWNAKNGYFYNNEGYIRLNTYLQQNKDEDYDEVRITAYIMDGDYRDSYVKAVFPIMLSKGTLKVGDNHDYTATQVKAKVYKGSYQIDGKMHGKSLNARMRSWSHFLVLGRIRN